MNSSLTDLSEREFRELAKARRGSNWLVEQVDNPVWLGRIRKDPDSWRGPWSEENAPEWHFGRYGMSRTILEDHTLVFIGGEHEMSGDPDFFIYNDVIEHKISGDTRIFAYSTDVFQPTDFHSATLVWGDRVGPDSIYIIGGLGYPDDRVVGMTPIYKLDPEGMTFESVKVKGIEPGWIWEHQALYMADQYSIAIWGGKRLALAGDVVKNEQLAVFDILKSAWSIHDSIIPTHGTRRAWE